MSDLMYDNKQYLVKLIAEVLIFEGKAISLLMECGVDQPDDHPIW